MSNESTKKHPVVEVARKESDAEGGTDKIITLSSGVKAKIVPVSASLIDEVTARVEDPEIPMWMNEQKGREEPNPSDPKYLRELDKAARQRGVVAMDALIMFGVQLVEPLPEDDEWIKKLKYVGIVVDPEDKFEREFFYKKYIAVSAEDINTITRKSGMSAEEVADAERSFRGNAK